MRSKAMIALCDRRTAARRGDLAGMPARRARASATKLDLAFVRGGEDQFVVKAAVLVEQANERWRSSARCLLRGSWRASTCVMAAASSAIGRRRRRDRGEVLREATAAIAQTSARAAAGGRSSKCNKALAEPVAAPAAREDQRHRRGGNRAVVMADQALEHPRLAASAARLGARWRSVLRRRGAAAAPSGRLDRAGRPSASASR